MTAEGRVILHTASFYAADDWRGVRYRVSRGHPRGRKTDWETLPFLYPARELLVAYRAGILDFEGLSQEYLAGLEEQNRGSKQFQQWLETVPSLGEFTLLCFERAGENCHRRVLAQWLLANVTGLELGHMR